MTERTLMSKLLDAQTAAKIMESDTINWAVVENTEDPDLQKFLPVWKSFIAAREEFKARLDELYVKHASELTL